MFLLEQIEQLSDQRKDINLEYELTDIVFLTMVAVLSGAHMLVLKATQKPDPISI